MYMSPSFINQILKLKMQVHNHKSGASWVAQWLRVCCKCKRHKFSPRVRKTPWRKTPWRKRWQVKVKSLNRVWLLATPWTAVDQAPPSMGFSRQEYHSGVPLPLQYSCLENSMDRAAWRAIVHGITKSDTTERQHACTQMWKWHFRKGNLNPNNRPSGRERQIPQWPLTFFS